MWKKCRIFLSIKLSNVFKVERSVATMIVSDKKAYKQNSDLNLSTNIITILVLSNLHFTFG